MPARPLDLEVMHGSRHVDGGTFQVTGDPGDAAWLQGQLRGWLAAAKWQPSRWREFRLIARPAGKNGPRTEVRA